MPDLAEPAVADTGAEVATLALPPGSQRAPAVVRRRSLVLAVAVLTVLAGLAGGGLWWYRQVTGDPGLEFYNGPNVYRDDRYDTTGIHRTDTMVGSEVKVDFVRNGGLHVMFGLYNGGSRDVRIEAVPPARMYYWGLERMGLSADRDDGWTGTATRWAPFEPFTLRRGETKEVRLEFRLADCDPAALQPGGYSLLRSLRLDVRRLGVTRTIDVPFRDAAVALHAMGICEHPMVEES